MAWTLVQSISNKSTVAGNTATGTLPGTATAGNLIVVVVNSNFIPSTPTGFSLDNNAINFTAAYTFSKIAAGGEQTITSTFAGSASWDIVIEEWSGNTSVSVLDKVASNSTQTATTLATGTTAALSASTDLAIYVMGSPAADTPNSLTTGTIDYAFSATDGTNVSLAVGHQLLASSAGASAVWGFNAGPANLIGSVTTYKLSTGNAFSRTAADSFTITDSLARSSQAFTRTATDSVPLTDVAARISSFVRTASDSFSITDALASTVTHAAAPVVKRGSWWHLDSILKSQAEYSTYYRMQEPVACPNCGEPLRQGPPQMQHVKYCPWGHFMYPRDYDMDTMSGM